MSKYKYSETERQINSVLKHHDEDLKSIHFPSLSEADATVAKADALLRRLGYQPDAIKGLVPVQPRKTMVIPTWEQCCAEAEKHVGTDCELESLFTEEELRSNELAIKQLNEELMLYIGLMPLTSASPLLPGWLVLQWIFFLSAFRRKPRMG